MDNIFIPRLLKMPGQTYQVQLNKQRIRGFDSLTPIQGTFRVVHRHTFLEVSLNADTILTLTCDRCLKTFNHRLAVNISEIILLQHPQGENSLSLEREVSGEDLSERLSPNGKFLLEEWIYEQLSLAMPLRNLCGNNCQLPSVHQVS